MRVVLAFVALITLGLAAACGGEAPPTPTPTASPQASYLDSAATARVAPTASREEVYQALESLNLGLLPLDRQGRDDWWSTRLPNADITIDIFGPEDRVEAVELWYRRSVPTSTAASVVEALAATIIPGEQARSMQWFSDSLEAIEQTGDQKQQTSVGPMYLTLYWAPRINQYFFSIDVEKQ